jgi:hypothetical protein
LESITQDKLAKWIFEYAFKDMASKINQSDIDRYKEMKERERKEQE